MPKDYAHFSVEVIDETHVMRLRNHTLIDPHVVTDLRDEMVHYVGDKTPRHLVISFKEVERFSSANFSALLDVNNLVKANKGELRLCDISDQIREVFEITKLDTLFEIYGSVPGAMDQFK